MGVVLHKHLNNYLGLVFNGSTPFLNTPCLVLFFLPFFDVSQPTDVDLD